VNQLMDQGGDILQMGQVALNINQELMSILLLLPPHHTLSVQAAMMDGDGSSAQERFLIQHEAIDLLGEAGALLLS